MLDPTDSGSQRFRPEEQPNPTASTLRSTKYIKYLPSRRNRSIHLPLTLPLKILSFLSQHISKYPGVI